MGVQPQFGLYLGRRGFVAALARIAIVDGVDPADAALFVRTA
ncbi:hypothetical protein ART_1928 [Arthrobacter sp. PAMC 25486]|nr:hypothetical protein ART_1928 [Arthrobacter sp. PAMC 25486]